MSELTEDDVIRLADKCFKTFFRKYFQYEESSGIVDGKTVYFRRLVANGVFDTESIKSDVAIDKIYINGEEIINEGGKDCE